MGLSGESFSATSPRFDALELLKDEFGIESSNILRVEKLLLLISAQVVEKRILRGWNEII